MALTSRRPLTLILAGTEMLGSNGVELFMIFNPYARSDFQTRTLWPGGNLLTVRPSVLQSYRGIYQARGE